MVNESNRSGPMGSPRALALFHLQEGIKESDTQCHEMIEAAKALSGNKTPRELRKLEKAFSKACKEENITRIESLGQELLDECGSLDEKQTAPFRETLDQIHQNAEYLQTKLQEQLKAPRKGAFGRPKSPRKELKVKHLREAFKQNVYQPKSQ